MSDRLDELAELVERPAREAAGAGGVFQHEVDAGLDRCERRFERAADRRKTLAPVATAVRPEMRVDETHAAARGNLQIVLQQPQRALRNLRIGACKIDEVWSV